MADLTVYQAELTAINQEIADLLAEGENFNWSVGHVKIDNTARLETLYERRKQLWEFMQHVAPVEQQEKIILGVNEFGEDIEIGE